jgi:hypothetical protein
VSTDAVIDATTSTATLGGKIIDANGSAIIELGVVADTIAGPTTTKNVKKFVMTADSVGHFSRFVISIPAGKTWYIRAFAKNAEGIGYGNEVTFQTKPDKIYDGNITLTTQQQVLAFGGNDYTFINGYLVIEGTGITDLSPLSKLATITLGLSVRNTSITDMRGLDNLQFVGYYFHWNFDIRNNPLLTSLRGLEKLLSVNGYFYVINCDALTDLKGLDNFTFSGDVRIEECDHLISTDGVEKLLFADGEVVIYNNPMLTNIRGFKNLSQISGELRIEGLPLLSNIDGLEKLETVDFVRIRNNPSLTNLNGLRNLKIATTGLNIDNNDALTSLTAFSQITKVDVLSVQNNNILTNLTGLNNIQNCRIILRINNNSGLSDFRGLERVKQVGWLEIVGNMNLLTLTGLDSLQSISDMFQSGNLYIQDNSQLQSLIGLQGLRVVKAQIVITTNSSLTDFCPLKPLLLAWPISQYTAQFNAVNPTQAHIINTCP